MKSWIDKLRLWRLRRRRYFRLDPEKMHPGDIIFSTERAPVSYMIRHLTFSNYSHAGIYLGHGLYAEAVAEGVRSRAATTIVKEMKVIRLKSTSTSEEVARAAADRVDRYPIRHMLCLLQSSHCHLEFRVKVHVPYSARN